MRINKINPEFKCIFSLSPHGKTVNSPLKRRNSVGWFDFMLAWHERSSKCANFCRAQCNPVACRISEQEALDAIDHCTVQARKAIAEGLFDEDED